MNKKYYYIGLLVVLVVVIIGYDAMRDRRINWMKTFYSEHTIPYGANAFLQLSDEMFEETTISRLPFNEVLEADSDVTFNGLAFGEQISFTTLDAREILSAVEKGGTFFFSSVFADGTLLDTLNIYVEYTFFSRDDDEEVTLDFNNFFSSKNRKIKLLNEQFKDYPEFEFRREDAMYYISSFDSLNTQIIAINEEEEAVAIRVQYGEGAIIFSTLPAMFTNIYLL
ncbi:MAG: hypothetical protein OEY34_06550, partial [Cyclobacteriaceae bacterium]|nr:hypothetical protein [Cyclobacteriaceae bacterium]